MQAYQDRERLKWAIVGLALLIGIFSLIYTQRLVGQLSNREMQQMNLFARAMQFLVTSDSDENVSFVLNEIISAEHAIPLILADETGEPIFFDNIDMPKGLSEEEEHKILLREIQEMQIEYPPIEVTIGSGIKQYVYYANSTIILQLKYFSYIQISVISVLAVLAYFIFSSSRRAEQNRVWVGLAKETAHQLGTPISSLMAWIEYFKTDPNFDQNIVPELEKDIQRLEMITARFSSIGSEPQLKEEDILETVETIVNYLSKRIPAKVKITVIPKVGHELTAMINPPLFEWVVENVCKNAVDAMNGNGKINIYLKNTKDNRFVEIDISDTGKGIPKNKLKAVFQPGYTTKKRGWGLGLTLVKRIVETYHRGRIFVLKSEIDVGTTFRVMIPKQ